MPEPPSHDAREGQEVEGSPLGASECSFLSPPEGPRESPPEGPRQGSPQGVSMVGVMGLVYGAMALGSLGLGFLLAGRCIFFHPAGVGEVGLLSWQALLGTAAGLGFGLLMVALSRLTTDRFAWGRRLHMEFHEVLAGLTARDAFWLALVSSLGEEALFRGLLQPSLGLLVTSALFGLAHLPMRRGLWPWPFLAMAMGLAFGWLFEWSGHLGAPIMAHFIINYLNLKYIAKVRF